MLPAEPQPDGALVAEALTKRFARVCALDELTLRVDSGAVVALVGPNGAGKTTLLRTWMGFERPTSGHVRTLGLDPWVQRRIVGRIAFLAQQPSLYRELPVSEHLELMRAFRPTFDLDLARRRVDSLGIAHRSRIGELSGGQAAQVAFAIAIGLQAQIILLDEPLASLDPLARGELLELVRDHASSSQVTVVISSHALAELETACSDLVVIANGRLMFHQRVEEARRMHWVVPTPAAAATERPIGGLPGSMHESVVVASEAPLFAIRPASLQEIAVAYLAAARVER